MADPVPGARADVELLHPVGENPGGWAEVMAELEHAGRGDIIGADQRLIGRFFTARSRALLGWSRRGLAARPRRRNVVRDWPVLRGPVRLEGRFADWG